jgi:hypothetical protein
LTGGQIWTRGRQNIAQEDFRILDREMSEYGHKDSRILHRRMIEYWTRGGQNIGQVTAEF